MLPLLLISATLALGLTMAGSDSPEDDIPQDAPEGDDLTEVENSPETVDLPEPDDAPSQPQASDDLTIGTGEDDQISTGDGDDTVMAGAGDDTVMLGAGNDQYGDWGRSDRDLEDMQGDDTISGGAGADRIIDSQGSNLLQGSLGGDYLDARDYRDTGSSDTLSGGYGDDTLVLDDGDVASGGEGEDYFDVFVNENDIGAAVTITDFDPDTEVVSVFIGRSLEYVIPEITITHDEAEEIATVLFDGTAIATLLNIDTAGFANTRAIIVG